MPRRVGGRLNPVERVLVERAPSPGKLEVLGAEDWPLERFPPGRHVRDYAAGEECYLVEGEAVLRCDGQTEEVAAGDLLFIPRGLTVAWEVAAEIEYHRRTSDTT